jgi:hypothetical protein
LVVGQSEAVTLASDGSGYAVPDGQPANPRLPGALADADAAFPGPDPAHLWIQTGFGADNSPPQILLVGFDGKPTGISLPVPDGGSVRPDEVGGLVLTDFGGTYALRKAGLHLITHGALITAGSTTWLAAECDDQHCCSLVAIDRIRPTRRVFGPADPGGEDLPRGLMSPDGATVALLREATSGTPDLHLLDLNSGAEIRVLARGPCDQQALVWSPDSRLLFEAGHAGSLCVIDRRTLQTRVLPAQLPVITELVFRSNH